MRLIYIAGPYTSADPWAVEQNIRQAEAVGYQVMKLGTAWPVIPHSNTRGYFALACTPQQAYDGTLELMRRCDAVLLTLGWATSKGAIREYEEAQRLKLPVFHYVYEVERWLLIL